MTQIIRLRSALHCAAILLLLCATSHTQAQDNWDNVVNQLVAGDATNPPPQGGVVFTGSSSITGWNKNLQRDFPGVPVIGRGFGGSTIGLGLSFMDKVVLPYKPRLVVFYAGENDISHGRTPEQTAEMFIQYSERLLTALPEARLLYISIKPSPLRWELQEKFDRANALIEAYCAKSFRTAFVDIRPYMLGADGKPREDLYISDRLHLNAEGYRIWQKVIAPMLEENAIAVATLQPEDFAPQPKPVWAGDKKTVFIDFGSPRRTTTAPDITWNNVTNQNQSQPGGFALRSADGQNSGITLKVTSPFHSANDRGTHKLAEHPHYPATATQDSLFGHPGNFSKRSDVIPVLELSGLDPQKLYTFKFFASRMGAAANRTTRYTLNGAEQTAVELNADDNIDRVATTAPIAPKADGTLTITLTPADANHAAPRFTFLGVLEILPQ